MSIPTDAAFAKMFGKLRFAVASPTGAHSGVWNISAHKNSVYVVTLPLGGTMKLSLHGDNGSLVCQMALTQEYHANLQKTGDEKRPSFIRWMRPPTPPDRLLHVVSLQYPVDYISGAPKKGTPKKPLIIFPGEAGKMAEVGLFYSRLPGKHADAILRRTSTPLGWFNLDNGDSVYIAGRIHSFYPVRFTDGQQLGPPGNLGLRVPQRMHFAGTPIQVGEQRKNMTMLVHSAAGDGKAMTLIEIGGATLTRTA